MTIRKQRTRTLIQLGGLIEKAGLMETFNISPGDDLQKDIHLKSAMFSLFGGLLEMQESIKKGDIALPLWTQKGAERFGESG